MLLKFGTALLMFSLMISSPLASAFGLSDLPQILKKSAVISGDFEQIKEIAMLNKPLVSRGDFILSENDGLLWQQATPFPVTLILSDKILRQQMPGQTEQVIRAKDNPMAFYFSDLFLDLFHADADVLTQHFSYQLDGTPEAWTLVLTPTEAPLTKVFSQITLSGSNNIDALTMEELRGDKTTVAFSNIQHASALSDEERRAFND
ncbi:outer membrane lipoprotein carrier protein LolA [Parasalinivibrio latis]|uniref:outer membrane lipoprotein carrier protein LolA n=1 Tax=Parasalinivibrio latis TaxID=2952610 RepID=UPI0030DEACFC